MKNRTEELTGTFLDHLGELRTRIVRAFCYLVAGWIIGYFLSQPIYNFLSKPLMQSNMEIKLVFTNFSEPFFLKLKVGLAVGILLTFPLIIHELWAFIAPGLTPKERRSLTRLLPLSIVLFAVGVLFGYWILPTAMKWFLGFVGGFQNAALYQNPNNYILFVLKMLLAFGIAFELPIVLIILGRLGIVSREMLWRYWRQSTVIISTLAMILTPSNDAFSMLAMAIPMVGLYFLSIMMIPKAKKTDEFENDMLAENNID